MIIIKTSYQTAQVMLYIHHVAHENEQNESYMFKQTTEKKITKKSAENRIEKATNEAKQSTQHSVKAHSFMPSILQYDSDNISDQKTIICVISIFYNYKLMFSVIQIVKMMVNDY